MKLPKSYKTTLCGVGVIAVAVLFKTGWLDQEAVTLALGVVTAIGFALSKDYNVSHKDKNP